MNLLSRKNFWWVVFPGCLGTSSDPNTDKSLDPAESGLGTNGPRGPESGPGCLWKTELSNVTLDPDPVEGAKKP